MKTKTIWTIEARLDKARAKQAAVRIKMQKVSIDRTHEQVLFDDLRYLKSL